MLDNGASKPLNPFRSAAKSVFVRGEPQDEALARIDYLLQHGAGWCLLSGQRGIGKSMLLAELARRAHRRGESCSQIDLVANPEAAWLPQVAEAWGIDAAASASPMELQRVLQERLVGLAAMN